MTPGPTLIYRCPQCQGQFSRETIASGNTMGARIRSDGKMDAPMLPRTPPLVACPHCNTPFCMIGAKAEAEFEKYVGGMGVAMINRTLTPKMQARLDQAHALRDQYRDVPGYGSVTVKQCFEYLGANALPQDAEIALRVYAWHLVNDTRMSDDGYCLDEDELNNLEAILAYMDASGANNSIMRAEVLRELGRFDEAANSIDCELPSEMAASAEQIMRAIERRDTAPFVFAPNDRDGDNEFTWAWHARRHAPDEPEEPGAALDPPVFRISNRDWWVKVLGMLQHNWALIESATDGKVKVYFAHDLGTTLNATPYKRHQVRDRCAIVDSLEFDTLHEAQRALRRNGFERMKDYPGPWVGSEPTGHFYDARATEDGVYSNKGYWA